MMDPRIGQLMRNGTIVHYAYTRGYDAAPVEGSLAEVEAALGLRRVPFAPAPVAPAKPARTLRTYDVTVTPKYKSYGTGWESAPYTVQKAAHTRAEAIKKAREEYSDNEGSMCGPATYTAKLATDE